MSDFSKRDGSSENDSGSDKTSVEKTEYRKKEALRTAILVALYAIGASAVPTGKTAAFFGGGETMERALSAAFRFLFSVLPIAMIFRLGLNKTITSFSGGVWGAVACLPTLLVAVANFPFVPLLTGDLAFNEHIGGLFVYVLYCVSIALLEESTFRGVVFPLLLYRFGQGKKGIFAATIASSALFGAAHLFNLLGGFSAAVFLQVGYSFLIGCACALALLFSGNLFVPVAVHAIFDFGGFLFDFGFVVGRLWTMENVVFTAAVAVFAAICMIAAFFKRDCSRSLTASGVYKLGERL